MLITSEPWLVWQLIREGQVPGFVLLEHLWPERRS